MTKKTVKKDIGDTLSELADKIAEEAMWADVPLAERVDAFKSLSTYFIAINKLKPKGDEEESSNFGAFRKKIEAVK